MNWGEIKKRWRPGFPARTGVRAGGLCILLLWVCAARAAVRVTFDIQPQVLSVGETSRLSITVQGADKPPEPPLPAIDGFQIQQGGRQSFYRNDNGAVSQGIVFTYGLTALREGKFEVGPLRYVADGETYESPKMSLEVAPAGASPDGATRLNEMLFATLETPRTNPFVQEAIPLRLNVYSLPDLQFGSDMQLEGMPTGGVSLSAWEELARTRERVGDRIFEVRSFQCRLKALSSGSVMFAPGLRINLRVPRENRRDRNDPFGMMDGLLNPFEVQPVRLTVKPVTLEVRPLPTEGRPASFAGAVGQFQFTAAIQPAETTVGNPVSLRMTVTGEGNPDAVTAPHPDLGKEFRVYDPRVLTQEFDERTLRGSKVFEIVALPLSEQVKEVPAVEFSWFDPVAESFRTLSAGPFPLHVGPAADAGTAKVLTKGSTGEVQTLHIEGQDILYLKDVPHVGSPVPSRLPGRAKRWMSLLVPPLFAAVCWIRVRRRERLNRDVALARRVRAPKAARGCLRAAEEAAVRKDRREVFEQIWKALAAYFGNRLNLPPGEVTVEAVRRALRAAGSSGDQEEEIRNWFERCDAERFGAGQPKPDEPGDTLEQMVQDVSRLLRNVERVRL